MNTFECYGYQISVKYTIPKLCSTNKQLTYAYKIYTTMSGPLWGYINDIFDTLFFITPTCRISFASLLLPFVSNPSNISR